MVNRKLNDKRLRENTKTSKSEKTNTKKQEPSLQPTFPSYQLNPKLLLNQNPESFNCQSSTIREHFRLPPLMTLHKNMVLYMDYTSGENT